MKEIDQILSEPRKLKIGYEYAEHDSYRGINLNPFTNDDISEAINTAAGIDDYLQQR